MPLDGIVLLAQRLVCAPVMHRARSGTLSPFVSILALSLGASLLAGCPKGPPKVPGLEDAVRARGDEAYVSGRILRLERLAVIEDRDFIYGIGLSPSADRAVHTRLAGKTMNAMLWTLGQTMPKGPFATLVADVALNDYEFDVEGVEFAPDGSAFVTAGRDGAVRAYDAKEAKLLREWLGDERLVTVAFTADGRNVIAGSQDGLLSVLSWPGLELQSEVRAHRDEVRSVAAVHDGRVVTGSWDKTVAVFAVEPRPLSTKEARLTVKQTQDKVSIVRVGLEGKAGVFTLDAGVPAVVVTTELAQAAGIQPALLSETVRVRTQESKLARGKTLTLKQFRLEGVDVAICDACVPKGAQGVLGAPLFERFDISQAVGSPDMVFVRKEIDGEPPPQVPDVPTLVERNRFAFEPHVNDVSVDREGKRLGVAFSNDKSERNREVYEREKRKEPAPQSPLDHPAIVSLETGEVLAKWPGIHRGVISTVGISPDGRSVVSGGWDNRLHVLTEGEPQPVDTEKFGWILRRVRFSRDGRIVAAGAWTPQNAVGDNRSDPSAVIYEVAYGEAEVR